MFLKPKRVVCVYFKNSSVMFCGSVNSFRGLLQRCCFFAVLCCQGNVCVCVWIYIYVVDVKRGKMQIGKNDLRVISVLGLGSGQVLSASRRGRLDLHMLSNALRRLKSDHLYR